MTIRDYSQTEIQITSVYFRSDPTGHHLESYPRQMVYEGQEYNFLEDGLRYLVQKGQQLVKLFDVSDGQTEYRLRLEGDNYWTLVGMKAAL